jgi:hypothetical protein
LTSSQLRFCFCFSAVEPPKVSDKNFFQLRDVTR